MELLPMLKQIILPRKRGSTPFKTTGRFFRQYPLAGCVSLVRSPVVTIHVTLLCLCDVAVGIGFAFDGSVVYLHVFAAASPCQL